MVHVKWLVALVLTAALSAYVSHYFTYQYGYERAIAGVSGNSMRQNSFYVRLVKDIDENKCNVARERLEKAWKIEVDSMKDFRKTLENGYFRNAFHTEISDLNRYLGPVEKGASK
ncbi:MAG TPA: hypothetical protein VEC06_21235 [Paucimonas sp.]|nr:hypothetical protein [Paucimonas sp.]